MPELNRVQLFGRLNSVAYKGIEGATTFCRLRGHGYVELVHWFHQLLASSDTDLHMIIKAFGLDEGRLSRDLTEALDRLPSRSGAAIDLSGQVDEAVERAWVYASLAFGQERIRSGHLLIGALRNTGLRNALFAMSAEFKKVKVDDLTANFEQSCAGSTEAVLKSADAPRSAEQGSSPAPAALGKQEALARYAVDLTERARNGEIDPIVGRDDETRKVVDVLMRRRQNNPILVGEAGVGKTAVVEGLALRIAEGDVPPALADVRLLALDLGLLQAGASVKGEFEQRLRQVIEEVQASPQPIVVFVDEAHTLIGAGGAQGTGDAANLLKPALARGTLRTVAATTWAEYKKHIEKDPALTRRFQVVQVAEPEEPVALNMLRKVAQTLELHHGVQISEPALGAAVRLSRRYIPDRQLPDKAVSLLDTACARVAMSQHALPASVEDARHRIDALEAEQTSLVREEALGEDVTSRKAAVTEELGQARDTLQAVQERWEAEKALVAPLLALRAELGAGASDVGSAERAAAVEKLRGLQEQLATLQGEQPLMSPSVDEQAVAAVVADWTGVPVGRMVRDELDTVLSLAPTLGKRIIGQRHALQMIAKRIQTSRAGIENPCKPVGVFLLAGPSGVGKTETALALAETLYGGEHNLITINMSEFQEAHTVSTLKGAPPGYVGYGEGGVLTEAVRRRPYSVVLLDEVEKAHPDVHEVFFQVFDKGMMEDGAGRVIDFKNTLILLTSNVGSDVIMRLCQVPDDLPSPDMLAQTLRSPLLEVFPAALLGRMVTIPYYPLSDAMLADIVRLQMRRIQQRMRDNRGVELQVDDAVVELVVARCTEVESGGRMVDAILTNTLLPELSYGLLSRMRREEPIAQVKVSVSQEQFSYEFA